MSEAAPERAPRLAFVYHPHSFGVFAVAEAARGVCELIWVVDHSLGDTATTLPLLRRLGTVIDVADRGLDDVVAAIAREKPDGILTLKDSFMRWTATVAERLGLPFHSAAVAERFTDKYRQRAALREGGVPVPGFWTVPGADDEAAWRTLLGEASFPAVLKPRLDSEGSRDTIRIADAQALRDAAAGAEPDTLVLEEYLGDRDVGVRPGFADYVSVETIVSGGVISHLAVTGRLPPNEPFRESGFFIDAELSPADREDALVAAREAVRALGVEIGCLHTEVKFTPQGPRVIELNGRIGGGVPEMLLDVTGIDLLGLALRLALGEPIEFARAPATDRVAYLFYVHAPGWMRRVTGVDGLPRLSSDPAVTEIILNRGPGQPVDWREGNHGHVFSVRGVVDDHDAVLAMKRRVAAEIQISGEDASGATPAPLDQTAA